MDKEYEKKVGKYSIDQIEAHPFWNKDFSIKVCKTMDYLMCETAMKFAKDAEKEKTVYCSTEEVNRLLIDKMNSGFGKDVFKLNVKTDNKYLQIKCKVGKCPFSVWLKYKTAPNGDVFDLTVFRFIIEGHDPCAHIEEYEKKTF